MFEEASKLKLRFATSIGVLSTEDLWDLKLEQLDSIAKNLNKIIKSDEEEESFIRTSKNTKTNKINKLKFDIVLKIINDKLEEEKKAKERKEKAKEREIYLELLHKKQMENKLNLSEEELLKKLQELE